MTTGSDAMADAGEGAIRKFLDAMWLEFGGPIALAKEVHHEYDALPEGAQGKKRILDRFLTLVEKFGVSDSEEPTLDEMEERLAKLEGEEPA